MNYIEERTYLPEGMSLDDPSRHSFQAIVQYRGGGMWAVVGQREAHEQFSRAGKWLFSPLKMTQMRWCRYDTFEEACIAAEKACELRTVMGQTYPELEEWRRTR
jgi:hypothetical protein